MKHLHTLPSRPRGLFTRGRIRSVLEGPHASRALPVEVGRRRPARAGNHMKPETVLRGRAADQDRRGHRARAGAERGHAVLRHAAASSSDQADVDERRVQPSRQQRGDRRRRDGPGRHAVRRVRPPDARDSLYNCFKLDDDLDAQRLHEAGDREGRLADDAGRADRRRGVQGRGDAARHLRDHASADLQQRARSARSSRCSRATPSSSTPAGARCGGRTTRAS